MRPKIERHDPAVVFEFQGAFQPGPVDAVAAHETHHDFDSETFGEQATIVALPAWPKAAACSAAAWMSDAARAYEVEVNESP